MQIEFTANELHTIAGALYPSVNHSEDYEHDRNECKTLVLEIGRCLINETNVLEVTETQAWDIRDAVDYRTMMGPEITGRSVHRKIWVALLRENGYVEVQYGTESDSTYKDAKARRDADTDTRAHETA